MAQKSVEAIDAAIRRWQRRLTRAANTLSKLQKTRARVLRNVEKIVNDYPKPKPPVTETTEVTELTPYFAEAIKEVDDLKIPNFLSRNPDQGTVIAAAKHEAPDRTAMPLSGNAAKEYLRKKSAEIEKKREKRDKAFFKKQ